MGTSQSKRDARPGTPLVPPWADPAGGAPGGPGDGGETPDPPAEGQEPAPSPVIPGAGFPIPLAEPRRYAGFRISLRNFARTGDRGDARRALRNWVQSTGGATTGSRRLARAASSGGAALAGVSRAVAGMPPAVGAPLDVRTLSGLPVADAVARIVDAFCPPGILDDELARIAVGEALAIALEGVDVFDPAAVDATTVRTATLALAAELVFVAVAADAGRAFAGAPSPAAAIQRENDIRAVIHEAADVFGAPMLDAWGDVLSPRSMGTLVRRLVEVVEQEIARW